ncbi:MAG: heparinase, partial [Sphingomonadales bacterium]
MADHNDNDRSPLQRLGGSAGPSLAERVSARMRDALYASPLHALRLKGKQPLKLLAVPVDPVPGNAAIGERVVAGRLIHAGHQVMVRGLDFADAAHPQLWAQWAHRWGWLRDLAAHVPDRAAAAPHAEALARAWLLAFPRFHPFAWRADVLGGRLLAALAHAPLLMSGQDPVWRSTMLGALATWARHLDRAAFRLPDGLGRLEALAALYAAGVLMPGGEKREARALVGLDKLLATLVLPDGGLPSRSPHDMVQAIAL